LLKHPLKNQLSNRSALKGSMLFFKDEMIATIKDQYNYHNNVFASIK